MRMLEKQYGAYHLIETLVKSCYDDVDDGRREGKEGERKEEKEKEEEERELAYLSTVTFSHQNIKSV